MITSAGAKCDVCGDFILPVNLDEMVNTFSVAGIDRDLHADNKCKEIVLKSTGNFKDLPDGPLRKCFEEAYQGND